MQKVRNRDEDKFNSHSAACLLGEVNNDRSLTGSYRIDVGTLWTCRVQLKISRHDK